MIFSFRLKFLQSFKEFEQKYGHLHKNGDTAGKLLQLQLQDRVVKILYEEKAGGVVWGRESGEFLKLFVLLFEVTWGILMSLGSRIWFQKQVEEKEK